MKGLGWIIVLLGLLGAGYLLARDLGVIQGAREGKVVLEPLEQARDAAGLVKTEQDALRKALDRIDE